MDKENMGYKIILSLSVILSFLIVNSAMAFSIADEFRVDQDPDVASDPSIAVDNNNHFIITWEETRLTQIPENDDIFVRIFYSDGTPLTNEFRVDQDSGTNEALQPVIATDGNNNFMIAWTDFRSGHGDIFAID